MKIFKIIQLSTALLLICSIAEAMQGTIANQSQGILYTNNGRTWESKDKGLNWIEKITYPMMPKSKSIEVDKIYYTENGKTYLSTDGGLTWTLVDSKSVSNLFDANPNGLGELIIRSHRDDKLTVDINIYNMLGTLELSFKSISIMANSTTTLNISGLSSAAYLCVVNHNSQVYSTKFIVSR